MGPVSAYAILAHTGEQRARQESQIDRATKDEQLWQWSAAIVADYDSTSWRTHSDGTANLTNRAPAIETGGSLETQPSRIEHGFRLPFLEKAT